MRYYNTSCQFGEKMASKGKKTAPINSKLSENVPNGPVSGHAKERSVSFSEDAKFYDDGTRSFFW